MRVIFCTMICDGKTREIDAVPQRILLVKTHAIGDTLLTTPAMRGVRKNFSRAYIALLTGKSSAVIVKRNPDIDEIISFDEAILFKPNPMGIGKLIRQVRQRRFDVAFVFQRSFLIHFLVWTFGIHTRIGFDNNGSGFFLTHRVPWDRSASRWTADCHLDLLRFIGAPVEESNLIIELSRKEEDFSSTFLQNNGVFENDVVIGMFPGGGKNSRDTVYEKRWPVENYAEVARWLFSNYDVKILAFGSSGEARLCRTMIEQSQVPVINACGKTTLKQLSALIKRCNLFITNDSAPLHIAVAVGIPTIALFGPTVATVIVPKTDRLLVIKSSYPCSPCYCNSVFPGCDNPGCMGAITTEEVLGAVENELKRRGIVRRGVSDAKDGEAQKSD